jgi:hypothetical protein
MTEAEWLACEDSDQMVRYLEGIISDRKLRLFGCACCRRLWPLLPEGEFRQAVEIAERYADGLATDEELSAVRSKCSAAIDSERFKGHDAVATLAMGCASSIARDSASAAVILVRLYLGHMMTGFDMKPLLSDVAGNPFRPPTVSSAWLSPNVVAVATTIYEEQSFDSLPILADALEDAGCTDAAILEHCRAEAHHARGCWVVDCVLGKS